MNVIYPSRPWFVRLATALLQLVVRVSIEVRILALLWNISSAERYLAACARDGLVDSLMLSEWRRQLEIDRAQLAILRAAR
jgi:hypothetical protein